MTENPPTATFVAVPMRHGSISGGRFDLAPDAIIRALDRYVARGKGLSKRIHETGVRVADAEPLAEVATMAPSDAFDRIRRHLGAAMEDAEPHSATVVLGGDNSITRPGVHAATMGRRALDRVGLLTLDAHHDLRDTDAGLTNGNPVRALLEDGLPGENVVQVGIQPFANSPQHAELARDAGIAVVTADEVRDRGIEAVVGEALDRLGGLDTVYVDLDVDVLDRAFAPACPGSRPGGLTPAQVQTAARLCGADPKVRAIDVVEVDPERDVADTTVLNAAGCLLAFASGLASRG